MKRIFLGSIILLFSFSGLCQDFVFVFLNKKQQPSEMPKAEVEKTMAGHMANINRLAKEGKLVAAGPFDGGGGIFIFKSDSKKQVEEWLSTDPGVQAKLWNIEIFPYQPRVGSVCLVGEPYEMINYTFVRFGLNLTKYTVTQLPDELKAHNDYLKKFVPAEDVVAEGSFGPEEGGILIMKVDVQQEVIERDPAIQKGFIGFDVKRLYIAKGSFCEPRQ